VQPGRQAMRGRRPLTILEARLRAARSGEDGQMAALSASRGVGAGLRPSVARLKIRAQHKVHALAI
jgi:hypothetical protein